MPDRGALTVIACGRGRGLAPALAALALLGAASCAPDGSMAPVPETARHLVLVTIDTLRADRVGAYGYAGARTPAIDGLAATGIRFARAFATAPITLPSHTSIMTGRYPPGHQSRHNGMLVAPGAITLADTLRAAGFATGAFVGAYPLDRRFGLARSFGEYGDEMPRDADGKLANERPGQQVVDEALAWLAGHRTERMFLWVHLFEPHAPYGRADDGRPADARYDDEVAEADRQVGRLVAALGDERARTAIVITSDHGEAFGEHGEIGHSVFVYDTTLRVPLVIAAPSVPARVVADDVSLVDVAPTVLGLIGVTGAGGDGTDLGGVMRGGALGPRALYAESFAPLLDFGWSPLRALRAGGLKYISAPRPELYDLGADAGESVNIAAGSADRARPLAAQLDRIAPPSLDGAAPPDRATARRLQALGYMSGARPASGPTRADPKDRVDMARRLAQVTSGELAGAALESTLRLILADEPDNPQAHLRLAYLLAESARCHEAEPHFRAVIAADTPTADAHLGLAGCLAQRGASSDAAALLGQALALEPDNPVVVANQGVLLSDAGRPAQAVPLLRRAVELDAGFLRARFALAVALARAGQRAEAELEARALLGRLPQAAPQRGEVERLLKALQ